MNQLGDSAAHVGSTDSITREISVPSSLVVLLFLVSHAPLVMAMKDSSSLATIHALGTLALGLFFLAVDREPYRVIYVMAYMVGAQLLWRISQANVYWEYGKYAVSLLLILAMLKYHRLSKADKKPLLYLVLLLPSIFVLPVFDRIGISFNLSGPLCLAVAAMFFSTVKLSRAQTARLFIAMLVPIVGVALLATSGTLAHEYLTIDESSKITSAGYGPNQVSSILGLGGMLTCLYAIIYREKKLIKMLMVALTIWLMAQSALTFSRGGLWTGFGAILVAAFYLIRDRKTRRAILLGGLVFFIIGLYIILPKLDEFTQGKLTERFQNFRPTGRDRILLSDLIIFRGNLLLGVGPGQSKHYRGSLYRYRRARAHTEFSRMLSEHGIFGLMALLILLKMSFQRYRSALTPQQKAIVLSFTIWAMLFMLHAGMRLAAPSFLFGLASATALWDGTEEL